jgi:ABC-2 type transport system permease protein
MMKQRRDLQSGILFAIVRHELRMIWRARVLVMIGAIMVVTLVSAAIVGHTRQAIDREQRARYQAIVGEQWREQPNRHPHRVSHYGFLLFRPPAPLGFFDTGVQSFTGSSIFLEAHRQNLSNFSDAAQADGTRRFGELTMAMVLQLFAPLIVFVIAGMSITREREAGTLALLSSQGVPWRSVLWGKVWAAFSMVGAVAGVVLVPVLWALMQSATDWNVDTSMRAALLVVMHAVYLVACCALAVLISAMHRSSRTALVTLVGLWIALWVILPRVLPTISESLHPIPTRSEFEAQVERRMRQLGDSHNPDEPKFQARRTEYLRKYDASGIDELPVKYNGVVTYEAEKLTTNAYREQLSNLLRTYREQARIIEWAGFSSPYVAIRMISAMLTGADVPHAIEFERQAEDYRYELIQKLNELHIAEVEYAHDRYEGLGEGGAPTRQRISREHWEKMPRFDFKPPAVRWALRQQRSVAFALFAWTTALIAALSFVGRRSVRI